MYAIYLYRSSNDIACFLISEVAFYAQRMSVQVRFCGLTDTLLGIPQELH